MKRFFLLLVLLLTGAPAWAQVIGNIDGVVLSGTQYRINGWACDTGVTASIDVHVYVGGPAGTGTGIAITTASNASEAAVATRCGTSGTAYRFSIPISDSLRTQHSNKKIYVHGISQTGGSNLTINNSGVFLVPPPLSQTRSYVYNAAQELCKTIEPETGATVMHYDAAGNLDWSAAGLNLTSTTSCQDTDASITARKVTRTYDARNRLKTLNFPDTEGNQTWTYFPDGLPASIAVTNPNVANPTLTSYAYNRRRLLTGESLNHLGGTSVWGAGYGYDANGALKIQTYPSGLSIDYAPNALGQPTQAGTYATGVSYYPNGAIAQFTYGNGIKHTLTQNLRQLPDRSLDDYGTSKFLDDSYDYDQNGNVAAISDGLTGNRGNRTMTYDELDRLTKVDSPMYGTDAANHVALYAYDGLDNLTAVVIGGTKARLLAYCYDANWRLTNVKNNFNGEGCAGSTVIGLSYDVQGNLANKNGQAFEFDYGNRLRNVPGKEWYAYDGQGRRVLSCTSAACSYQMYSQAGQLLTSYDYRNNKRVESIYLGGSLVALRELDTTTSTTTTKYQHTDALGSPVAETNPSRTILEKSEYEPFGQVLNRPLEDGPGYTGHTLDASTGLNYMQQRYYDPNIGRFLSTDPVTAYEKPGQNFNRYWYANNNPYKFTDPDGRIVKSGDPADNKAIEGLVNARANGEFRFNSNNELQRVGDGNEGAFPRSDYYNTQLEAGINSIDTISVDIDSSFIDPQTGFSTSVDGVAGGGVTIGVANGGNQSIIISGNENTSITDSSGASIPDGPADILLHEFVGHAVPHVTAPDSGNAVDNENKARGEMLGSGQRAPEPWHTE